MGSTALQKYPVLSTGYSLQCIKVFLSSVNLMDYLPSRGSVRNSVGCWETFVLSCRPPLGFQEWVPIVCANCSKGFISKVPASDSFIAQINEKNGRQYG